MIEFLYMWNQYLWPLITNSNQMRVVQIGVKCCWQRRTGCGMECDMAGTLITMIPPLLVLLLLQRSLSRLCHAAEKRIRKQV
jgi:sn-glycerol 3-phosphate transport system permease protein